MRENLKKNQLFDEKTQLFKWQEHELSKKTCLELAKKYSQIVNYKIRPSYLFT